MIGKKYIQCKTFKDYNKMLRKRKYFARHEWFFDRGGKCHNAQYRYIWRIWLSYRITSIQEAEEALRHTKWCKGNLRLILNELIEDYGKRCMTCEKKEGVLYGVELTNEDYYYMIRKDDGGTSYESCVGKYELI